MAASAYGVGRRCSRKGRRGALGSAKYVFSSGDPTGSSARHHAQMNLTNKLSLLFGSGGACV